LLALAVLAMVTGCGSSNSANGTPSADAGSPSAAAGSPSAAAGSPSAPVAALPAGVSAGAVCADVSAEIIAYGAEPQALQGAEAIYHINQAQVMTALNENCPKIGQMMAQAIG
jgi:DNA uptake protein ComE-like DNA-binding protein